MGEMEEDIGVWQELEDAPAGSSREPKELGQRNREAQVRGEEEEEESNHEEHDRRSLGFVV